MSKSTLIIFVKNAVKGKVKTRLAASVGADKALEIYLRLLQWTHHITKGLQLKKAVYYSETIAERDLWSEGFYQYVQSSGDLGVRMNTALEEQFISGEKVCVIGSDCAELSEEIIDYAYAQLELHDVVIGPAIDGGYYLIGMKEHHSQLFMDVKWSTSEVLSQTVTKAGMLGLSHKLLPTLSDVDTIEDWNRVEKKMVLPSDNR